MLPNHHKKIYMITSSHSVIASPSFIKTSDEDINNKILFYVKIYNLQFKKNVNSQTFKVHEINLHNNNIFLNDWLYSTSS